MFGIDFESDVVARAAGTTMRLATFNVENLFSRPIAMSHVRNATGQPYLDAYHRLNSLFALDTYDDAVKSEILDLLVEQGLHVSRPRNKYIELRKIRGNLVSTSGGVPRIVAGGRNDWIGWLELKEEAIQEDAVVNTARVIAAVDADVLVVVEAEDRPGLIRFHDSVLEPILEGTGRSGYPYVLVIDGNDPRGIDVAVLSRFPIPEISTHVFDRRGRSSIFARDCAEYFVEVPGVSGRMVLLANHFTSKGSDFDGTKRRIHQARRVREIVEERLEQGFSHVAVCGDLNDEPDAASLQPLLGWGELTDAVALFAIQIDPSGQRLGTYGTGKSQLDYLLLSRALREATLQAGIERRGYYAPRTFPSFDSVTSKRSHASDHHCVWTDLRLG